MKRLRDMPADDPALREAQRLLDAVDPLPHSPARARRVRKALAERSAGPGARAGALLSRRGMLLLACALLFAGTTLAAAQGGDMLRAVFARVIGAGPSAVSSEVPPATRGPRKRVAPPRAESPRHATPEPVRDQQASTASTAPSAPAPQHAQSRSADNELVRRAVIALRRDHDAERAARLLESVHARSSRGPLAEEVMSLRVEAALARSDPRARDYARQYLAAYPQGRYRALSQRVLDAPP
jgi:hypothetical protein